MLLIATDHWMQEWRDHRKKSDPIYKRLRRQSHQDAPLIGCLVTRLLRMLIVSTRICSLVIRDFGLLRFDFINMNCRMSIVIDVLRQ